MDCLGLGWGAGREYKGAVDGYGAGSHNIQAHAHTRLHIHSPHHTHTPNHHAQHKRTHAVIHTHTHQTTTPSARARTHLLHVGIEVRHEDHAPRVDERGEDAHQVVEGLHHGAAVDARVEVPLGPVHAHLDVDGAAHPVGQTGAVVVGGGQGLWSEGAVVVVVGGGEGEGAGWGVQYGVCVCMTPPPPHPHLTDIPTGPRRSRWS